MESSELFGKTAKQLDSELSLPKMPTREVTVNIPAGTRVRIGIVAEHGDQAGGALQIEILDHWDPSWFVDTGALP